MGKENCEWSFMSGSEEQPQLPSGRSAGPSWNIFDGETQHTSVKPKPPEKTPLPTSFGEGFQQQMDYASGATGSLIGNWLGEEFTQAVEDMIHPPQPEPPQPKEPSKLSKAAGSAARWAGHQALKATEWAVIQGARGAQKAAHAGAEAVRNWRDRQNQQTSSTPAGSLPDPNVIQGSWSDDQGNSG